MDRVAVFDIVHQPLYLCCEPITGNMRLLAERMRQEQFKVVYRAVRFTMRDGEEFCPTFEPFVKLCYLRGDMWMVIDEAHLLCNAHTCPDMLLTAVRLGRFRRLNIVIIAHSFSAISRPITENADEFLFWRILEPSSLDGIRKRCGDETMRKVQELRVLETTPDNKLIQTGQMLRWNRWQGIAEITP